MILECPNCGDKPHRVVKGRISDKKDIVFDGLVRCTGCGELRRETIRESKPLSIPIVVSSGESSERRTIELNPKLAVSVGDRFRFEGRQIVITGIEAEGRRPDQTVAAEVDTLWAKRMDKVTVKFSISRGDRTISREIEASPDEEFFTGDLVEFGRVKAVIHRIKTTGGLVRDGSARAEEIVRIYATPVKRRFA